SGPTVIQPERSWGQADQEGIRPCSALHSRAAIEGWTRLLSLRALERGAMGSERTNASSDIGGVPKAAAEHDRRNAQGHRVSDARVLGEPAGATASSISQRCGRLAECLEVLNRHGGGPCSYQSAVPRDSHALSPMAGGRQA